eukprot:scpid58587/ scgid34542/ 
MSYEIKYRKSGDHGNADGLSRLPLPHTQEENLDWAEVFNMAQIDPLPVTAVEVARHTARDPVLAKVLAGVRDGWSHSPTDGDMQPFARRKNELGLHQICLMWGIQVVPTLTTQASTRGTAHRPSRHGLYEVICP